ncbi:hypothetical protein MBBAR_10c00290 [Methanobrevibacter arboriphilus JCM 13429 = DSM 1125]|uniref:Uncharacterized protein n=1 Tax=Methanobrevibacter arboriphilus JCM 13429 = DSM 1125 TaxID=1300164 RepID=A0A1V6N1W2_METAZ|nr:hypothetical protein [Methanobrevibacter arboriphilus]OQD58688.1 hypothetical protein MBBAR_10c00290 [Methanobrevibacter arboriphilus JCM 13429 = DSM 1125]
MIDKERLKENVMSYVDESLHPMYDFDQIVNNAYINDKGEIIVKVGTNFRLRFDSITYEQLGGAGGGI